jgi:predicted ATP-grasp superfamily ATP-dependent carboligase
LHADQCPVVLALFGPSVRAAAASAIRAGLVPLAFDHYGDLDLRLMAQVETLPPDVDTATLGSLLAHSHCDAWLYTGGWENDPERVDRLSRIRPLWGQSGDVLRHVRDPLTLAQAVRRAGHCAPRVQLSSDGLPRDGTWLRKPVRSAGGRGIEPWTSANVSTYEPTIFQQRIAGTPAAAIYVASVDRCSLIGLTTQILGRPGAEFAYAGSIGPWPLATPLRQELEALGDDLAAWAGLRGLFGVDLIVDADSRPWVIEVNPRYTASVEVLDLALGHPLLADHARAFGYDGMESATIQHPRIFGKAILYADAPLTVPDLGPIRPSADPFDVPEIADVPAPGTRFEPGQPVLTVLVADRDLAACHSRLERALAKWRGRLYR